MASPERTAKRIRPDPPAGGPFATERSKDYLSALPNELLLQIFSGITHSKPADSNPDRFGTTAAHLYPCKDYHSLALTCRSRNRAATTLLYEKYDHNWDSPTSATSIQQNIENPTIGALVKEVKELVCFRWKVYTYGLENEIVEPAANRSGNPGHL
jgi:hypothetical protein